MCSHKETNKNAGTLQPLTKLSEPKTTVQYWYTMKPINQSQNHGIANRIVSLLISACKVVLQIFTFVLNGKPGSVISPTFPIYYHHLWGGFHCWSHSMRLFAFILGERGSFFFSFVDVVFFWGGGARASWIVCQSIHCFLLIMTCGFEKRKRTLHFSFPFFHLLHAQPPESAGKPQSGNGVFSTQIPVKCRKDSKITRALLNELSTLV